MSAGDRPGAEDGRRDVHSTDAEALQCQGCAADIHQGVHGADLVKVDLFRAAPMHAPLGLCDPCQDPHGEVPRRRGQP